MKKIIALSIWAAAVAYGFQLICLLPMTIGRTVFNWFSIAAVLVFLVILIPKWQKNKIPL